jgi:hypothetical protein
MVDASDDLSLTAIRLSIDGTIRSVTDMSPLSYSWNTRRETRGAHSISAVAEDNGGNIYHHTTVSVTVNVDLEDSKISGRGKGNGKGEYKK